MSEPFCLIILFNLILLCILIIAGPILVHSIHFVFLVERLQSMLLRFLSHKHIMLLFSVVILDSISLLEASCTQIPNIWIIVLILPQNWLFHHVVVLASCVSSVLVLLPLIFFILSLLHAEVHHVFEAFVLGLTSLFHHLCLFTRLRNFLLHPIFFKLENLDTVLYELSFYWDIYSLVLSLE